MASKEEEKPSRVLQEYSRMDVMKKQRGVWRIYCQITLYLCSAIHVCRLMPRLKVLRYLGNNRYQKHGGYLSAEAYHLILPLTLPYYAINSSNNTPSNVGDNGGIHRGSSSGFGSSRHKIQYHKVHESCISTQDFACQSSLCMLKGLYSLPIHRHAP